MKGKHRRMTDLNTFYSMVSVDVWRQVLGDEMFFYHGDYGQTRDFAEAQRQTIHNFLAWMAPGARVLDVGCGWGGSLRLMAAQGFDAQGTTISERQAAYCQQIGLPARYEDLNADPLTEAYDTILSIEVLDHFARRAEIFEHFRAHARQLAISINCVADGFSGERLAYHGTMPMCSTSELRHDIEAAGWRIVHWRNRRQASLPTLFHWRHALQQAFDDQPPPGVFDALYDMTHQFAANPMLWAHSFPLIDVVAE